MIFEAECFLHLHFGAPPDVWRWLVETCDLAGYVRGFRQPPPGYYHIGAVRDWLREVAAGRWGRWPPAPTG